MPGGLVLQLGQPFAAHGVPSRQLLRPRLEFADTVRAGLLLPRRIERPDHVLGRLQVPHS